MTSNPRKPRIPIKRKGSFFVYILRCRNSQLYTGYTNNLPRRLREHTTGRGGAKSLRGRKPIRLVYAREYKYFRWALREERRIKKLSKQSKETLVSKAGAVASTAHAVMK